MWSSARTIAAGDLVIVWLTRDLIQPLYITPGKEFNSKFGVYRHADLVGVPYGSKVGSRNGRGFIHLLRPTPELWTVALPHRTQILYLADIAFITSWLDIKSGSRVIEAGTGSGSFTHSTARTIGPSGHLWSYEFHEARYNKAREEFGQHGMQDIVSITHRNVCKEGFTVEDTVDSVFLDLPAPWDAVEHAKQALRKDRLTRICCFSPCMEQVLRTVSALNDAGFTEITMYETLLRPQDISQVPPLQTISEASERLRECEKKREEKRIKQIADARSRGGKRKRDGNEDEAGGEGTEPGATQEEDGLESKRAKTEEDPSSGLSISDVVVATTNPEQGSSSSSSANLHIRSPPPSMTKISLSKTFPEVRGHTSYLTFACLLPAFARAAASQANSGEVDRLEEGGDGVTAGLKGEGIGSDSLSVSMEVDVS
ncbi:hypothetical protein JAAARDRAFT_30635 [Jaapia argillacea MUCL 33604]|uniref:tRNA (adenine(58)-N(1))-methyltransferase catalytic subunit TRM61 n=1 Tax=Jaapia argillacea MUCL 33604 TaxID=933084 RepID=A0A067QJD0_9AGAM|nr:hypothetical protein JAAARDRAFT_30635 [Jaapia argillacea MUCL 33604]